MVFPIKIIESARVLEDATSGIKASDADDASIAVISEIATATA